MNCEKTGTMLHGLLDGELAVEQELQLEMHLNDCRACAQLHSENTQLVEAIAGADFYYRAPRDLRGRIVEDISTRGRITDPEFRPVRRWWLSWTLGSAAVAAALLIAITLFPSRSDNDLVANEVVSSHVRSLMVDHLTDVPSSDKHTVKPWFDGRIDFAPPVTDLESKGFSLIGGRLDYVSNRPAAALVYKRRQHIINLFIFQGEATSFGAEPIQTIQGYNLVHWNKSGMSFWAVSDLNPEELQQFAQLYQN